MYTAKPQSLMKSHLKMRKGFSYLFVVLTLFI